MASEVGEVANEVAVEMAAASEALVCCQIATMNDTSCLDNGLSYQP